MLQAPPLLVTFCPVGHWCAAPLSLGLESSKYLGDEVAFKVGVNRGAPRNMGQEGDKSLHLVDHRIGKWHFFPVLICRQAARAKNSLNLCVHLFCRAKERHKVSFPQWQSTSRSQLMLTVRRLPSPWEQREKKPSDPSVLSGSIQCLDRGGQVPGAQILDAGEATKILQVSITYEVTAEHFCTLCKKSKTIKMSYFESLGTSSAAGRPIAML